MKGRPVRYLDIQKQKVDPPVDLLGARRRSRNIGTADASSAEIWKSLSFRALSGRQSCKAQLSRFAIVAAFLRLTCGRFRVLVKRADRWRASAYGSDYDGRLRPRTVSSCWAISCAVAGCWAKHVTILPLLVNPNLNLEEDVVERKR